MAGVIQVGDLIKFTELALQIWNYGWASENNAGNNYRAFGNDVYTLYTGLTRLEDAVTRAQQSLLDYGAEVSDFLGGDRRSLSEIIGDYEDTLRECGQLVEDNRRYAQTTGPMENIDWNFNIMPKVEHLQRRIQMHNSRIQHMLKPFEIDLITKIHQDLVRRLWMMHRDILGMRRDINTLISMCFPAVAEAIALQSRQDLYSVEIPTTLLERLEHMFERRQSHRADRSLSLAEMADCFLDHLGKSTVLFRPGLEDSERRPPVAHYLALLKCQLLIKMMKRSETLQNPPRMSHWPGYVDALEEELSQECSRFQAEMIAPDTSMCDEEMLAFWPEDERKKRKPRRVRGPPYDYLFKVSLATESPDTTWRMLQLLRQTDSDHRFRTTETWGFRNQPPTEEPKVVDFDIRSAVLIPVYADPVGQGATVPPLEIIIEENHIPYHYLFDHLQDVLLFQQALTGFKVVDNYTEPYAVAVFVKPGREKALLEDATVQLWIPSYLRGSEIIDLEGAPVGLFGVQVPPAEASRQSIASSQTLPVWNSGYRSSVSSLGERNGSAAPTGTGLPPYRGGITGFVPKQTLQTPTPPTSPRPSVSSQNWAGPSTPMPRFQNSPTPPPASNSARVSTQPNMSRLNGTLRRQHPSRSNSTSSYQSTAARSFTSHNCSSSETTITVRLGNTAAGTGHGLISTRPSSPLLVLFTKDADASECNRSIVAITLDDGTKPNLDRCKCLQPNKACRITALERNRGISSSMLDARRLERRAKWDLLPLSASRLTDAAPAWGNICRVSILFPTVQARLLFGGGYCECPTANEGDVDECLARQHQGLLGIVKAYHRRQLVLWQDRNDNLTDVVNRAPIWQPH